MEKIANPEKKPLKPKPTTILIQSGKNINWINPNGECVCLRSVGNSCFVQSDVTFGKNVTLNDKITIWNGCSIGVEIRNCKLKINPSPDTIICSDVSIFSYAKIIGNLEIRPRVEANTIVINNKIISLKATKSRILRTHKYHPLLIC